MQPLLLYSVQIAEQSAHGHVPAGDSLARAVLPADDEREIIVHRLGKAGADSFTRTTRTGRPTVTQRAR